MTSNELPKQFEPNVGGPGWPSEMMQPENWKWFLAVIDWDWRNTRPLDALLAGSEVPEMLVATIKGIRDGDRQPKTQQAVNAANIRGADRMRIAAEVSNKLGLNNVNRFHADNIASWQGDIDDREQRELNKFEREEIWTHARDVTALGNVNREALEDWVRELRGYAKRWPNI